MESENVKERLTCMLHKKLSDLQEREQKPEYVDFSKPIKQENDETQYAQKDTINTGNEPSASVDKYQEPTITLQEILDEKKKALLRHPDVIKYFANKN